MVMAFFLPVFLGLLSTVLVVVCALGIFLGTHGLYITGINLFKVFPLGGLTAGLLCSLGVVTALALLKQKPRAFHFGLASILGVLAFCGLYLSMYGLNCMGSRLSSHQALLKKTTGETFEITSVKSLSFLGYLQQRMTQPSIRKSSFGHKVAGPFFNWLLFSLEGLGMMMGAGLGVWLIKN